MFSCEVKDNNKVYDTIAIHFEYSDDWRGHFSFKQHLIIDESKVFFKDIDNQIDCFEKNKTFEFSPNVSNGEIYLIFNSGILNIGLGSYGEDKGYHSSNMMLGLGEDIVSTLMNMLLEIKETLND